MIKPLSYFHLITTCARVQDGDKFLIAQRSLKDSYKAGERTLPGGKLERQEKSENLLERNTQKELREEVGVEVEDDMILLNNASYTAKTIQVVRFVYLCQLKSGKARPLEDTEAIKRQTIPELEQNKDLPKRLQKEVQILKKYMVNS